MKTTTTTGAATMTTTIKDARVRDALRWVAQEARALNMLGAIGPNGSRLREALAALDGAYAGPDEDHEYEVREPHQNG